MGLVNVPAHDDVLAAPAANRGATVARLLGDDVGVVFDGAAVLDLGCGYGSIALAAVALGADVTAMDRDRDRLSTLEARAHTAGLNVDLVHGELASLPFADNRFDVAFLLGVVEYAGLGDDRRSVRSSQAQVLAEAHRVLRPGGTLILGSKNRLWPPFALRDPHVGLPLVNVLPRRAADVMSRCIGGARYRQHIYSRTGWRRLLQTAGFARVECFVPVFSYQYPVAILRDPQFRDFQQALRRSRDLSPQYVARAALAGRRGLVKAIVASAGERLSISLTHGVLLKATK